MRGWVWRVSGDAELPEEKGYVVGEFDVAL
jgi:hypothetical protein